MNILKVTFLFLVLALCSCGPQTTNAEKAQVEAANACKAKGGIAIVDSWGIYQRCDFLEPKK